MVDCGRGPDVFEARGGLSPFGATGSTGSGPSGLSTDSATVSAGLGGLTKPESEQQFTYGSVG